MRALAVVVLAALAVGCGAGGGATTPTSAASWRANAVELLGQLQNDLAATQLGGTTRAAATQALRDLSDSYALLIAYTDLGGCGRMAGDTGAPPAVLTPLVPACRHLERAAALFGRAERAGDPGALARATREAALAEPGLVRALAAAHVR
jgi:hypothetical protein